MESALPTSPFAPTRWSLIGRARGDSPEARLALGQLCEAYWQPVFRFLEADGRGAEAARECAQEFFAGILERGPSQGALAGADPTRGRFRSFLLGAVKHFLADRRAAELCQKRGGGQVPDSLEGLAEIAGATDSAAGLQVEDPAGRWDVREFDRLWAVSLTARAVSVLEQECAAGGKTGQFQKLKPWLMGDGGVGTQAALAAELSISEGAVKVAIHRLRKRFREIIRLEIAHTVPDWAEVDDELRYLISVLGREG